MNESNNYLQDKMFYLKNFSTDQELIGCFLFFYFVSLCGKILVKSYENKRKVLISSSRGDGALDKLILSGETIKVTYMEKSDRDGNLYRFFSLPKDSDLDTENISYLYTYVDKKFSLTRDDEFKRVEGIGEGIFISDKTYYNNRAFFTSKKNVREGCTLYCDLSVIAKDSKIKKLLSLYIKYFDKREYMDKATIFEEKVAQEPKFRTSNNVILEEPNSSSSFNRINFESLADGEIYFIQGPPGTGKTTLISRLINENNDEHGKNSGVNFYEKNYFDKIIIASKVHQAVNNAVERILGDVSVEDSKLYEDYQMDSVLYSNRPSSKIEDSLASKKINFSPYDDITMQDKVEVRERARKNLDHLKAYSKQLDDLVLSDNLSLLELTPEELENSDKDLKYRFRKFKRESLKHIDGEIDFYELSNDLLELSESYNRYLSDDENIDWATVNYINAIKENSNVIFSSLDTLDKTIEQVNKKASERLLIVIDEASKSTILHYLTLLDEINKYTILVVGDPNQLSDYLVFPYSSDKEAYTSIMNAFSILSKKRPAMLSRMNYSYIANTSLRSRTILIENCIDIFNEIIDMDMSSIENTVNWKEILTSRFFEDLYNYANPNRKAYLKYHRRSDELIFNLTSSIYNTKGNEWYRSLPFEDFKMDRSKLILSGGRVVNLISNIESFEDVKFSIYSKLSELNDLKDRVDNPKLNVGVISLYSYNINKIKEKCEVFSGFTKFLTIDKSQGTEFDILLLDLSLNENPAFNKSSKLSKYVWQEPQRLNVALSRAVYQIYIYKTRDFNDKYTTLLNDEVIVNDRNFIKFKSLMDSISEAVDNDG